MNRGLQIGDEVLVRDLDEVGRIIDAERDVKRGNLYTVALPDRQVRRRAAKLVAA